MLTTILKDPPKGEKYDARHRVIMTIDALLSYKRGRMKGVSPIRAKAWEDGLKDYHSRWTLNDDQSQKGMEIDDLLKQLVIKVAEFSPVKEDDTRGY